MGTFRETALKSAEDMRVHLTEKAMDDSNFRERLMSDPKSVFFDEFGITVPDNIDIHVHESTLNQLHLALPVGSELDEEQLESVAAGLCCCI